MDTARPRRTMRALPLLLLLVAPGCASDRYRMEFELPAGEAAELTVLGDELTIRVDNAGPGGVRLLFDAPQDAWDEEVVLDVASTQRLFPGPVALRCTALGELGTRVLVLARGCEGMALDQRPGPREARDE